MISLSCRACVKNRLAKGTAGVRESWWEAFVLTGMRAKRLHRGVFKKLSWIELGDSLAVL